MSYNNGDLITIGQVKTALQRVDSEITTRAGSSIDLPESDGKMYGMKDGEWNEIDTSGSDYNLTHETWTFTLSSGSTVTKDVVIWQ